MVAKEKKLRILPVIPKKKKIIWWKKNIYPVIFEKKSLACFFFVSSHILFRFGFSFTREFIRVRLLTLYNFKTFVQFLPMFQYRNFYLKKFFFWLAVNLSSLEFIHNVISRRRRFVAENENYKSEINVFRSNKKQGKQSVVLLNIRLDLIHIWLDFIHMWLDLIH